MGKTYKRITAQGEREKRKRAEERRRENPRKEKKRSAPEDNRKTRSATAKRHTNPLHTSRGKGAKVRISKDPSPTPEVGSAPHKPAGRRIEGKEGTGRDKRARRRPNTQQHTGARERKAHGTSTA